MNNQLPDTTTTSTTFVPVMMDLQSPQHHQQRERKPSKAYHIVPQDDAWKGLQEPLSSSSSPDGSTKSKRVMLATSRVERDKLMVVMEDLILKEAELASAYELFEYTRMKSCAEHDEIVAKLKEYEALLEKAMQQEKELDLAGVQQVLKTQEDKERWQMTQNTVTSTLPELLIQLEDKIEMNGAKIRHIQEKMEEIRAKRLSVREEIAEKEEDIALALATASPTT